MLQPDDIITGKYQVNHKIGDGGMGCVYSATHTALRRADALKVLHEQFGHDPSFVERFFREARAMARLNHENIIRVYDVFQHDSKYFIAMEYFHGKPLNVIMRDLGAIAVNEALYIIYQAAKALAFAHKQGIIHRDVKPGNILIDEKGRVKLVDFGIAAARDDVTLTSTGQLVGSPRYMSPEQARSEPVTERSDLFSLGMVFYEMVTGTTPFEGDSGVAIIGKLAYQEEELELKFPDYVDEAIRSLIRSLLKRKLSKRMDNAETLVEQIGVLLNLFDPIPFEIDRTIATDPTLKQRNPTLPGHSKKYAFNALAALVLLTVAGGVGWYIYTQDNAPGITLSQPDSTVSGYTNDSPDKHANAQQLLKLQNELTDIIGNVEELRATAASLEAHNVDKTAFDRATQLLAVAQQKYRDAQLSVQQQSLDKAHNELMVALSYFNDTAAGFSNLIQRVQANNDGKLDEATNAFTELEQFKDRIHTAMREYQNSDSMDDALYKNALTKFQNGERKYLEADAALRVGKALIALNKINQANRFLKQAQETLQDSTAPRDTGNIKQQVLDAHAQLRGMQLSILQAAARADEADAKQNATVEYENAVNLSNLLTEQSLLIGKFIDKQDYSAAQAELSKAAPLANETRQAFLSAAEATRGSGKAQQIARTTIPVTPIQTTTRPAAGKPTLHDVEAVEQLLFNFVQAYRNKDLKKLDTLSTLSTSRREIIQQIFENFNDLDVSISGYSLSGEVATAQVTINSLKNSNGDAVTPGESWRNGQLHIRKSNGNWQKIIWE